MEKSPPSGSPMRARIASSVISSRSIFSANFSSSSCGGASTIQRNPFSPCWLNHVLAASDSAMGAGLSSFSPLLRSFVALMLVYALRVTCKRFFYLNALFWRNKNASVTMMFSVPILVCRLFLVTAHARRVLY